MFRVCVWVCLWAFVSGVNAQQAVFSENGEFYILSAQQHPVIDQLPAREQWQKARFAGLPFDFHDYWVQADFQIEQLTEQPQGVFISLLGAYEVYWNGELIGKNGQFADSRESEVPGQIEAVFLLRPELLSPGKHTLTIRGSSHHIPADVRSGLFFAFVDSYEALLTLTFKQATLPMIMSGALLLVAAYCLFLYFTAWREASYLFFGTLCLVVLSLYVAESWRGLWGYSYDWHIPRMQLILALSCAAGMLMTFFYGYFFKLKSGQLFVWAGIAAFAQIFTLLNFDGYDARSLYVFMIGTTASLMITFQAIFLKRDNAKLMLSALLLLVAPIYLNTRLYMEQYFFISFTVLIGIMLYSLTATFRSKQQQLAESQLNAARLELELVKRNLQPHFILNTLTAVEEWIEESPKTAVAFIQALADEFRYMAQLSSRKLVTLQEEVSLCQAHLKVMGYRANVEFSLDVAEVRLDSLLPPGIVLTLMENAISHNHYGTGKVVFSLRQIRDKQGNKLEFIAPVVDGGRSKALGTGTGMKYIHASMAEQYGANWSCQQSLDNKEWSVSLYFTQTISPPHQQECDK